MDDIIKFALEKLFSGSPEALLMIAIAIVGGLLWERNRLVKLLEKKDDKIDQIIDDYHKGNITLADALTSLKLVLFEIKSKL